MSRTRFEIRSNLVHVGQNSMTTRLQKNVYSYTDSICIKYNLKENKKKFVLRLKYGKEGLKPNLRHQYTLNFKKN